MSKHLATLGVGGWLNRALRLFGTALSFTVFGVGGLLLGILVFPFLFVFVHDPARRQEIARRWVGRGFRAFVWMMKSLGVLTYEIDGQQHMVDVRRTLIIANHPSLIDVVFLVGFFPRSECIVKRAVMRNPFMIGVVTAANYISNSDPEIMLETAAERLEKGSSLVMFPEGTRRDQHAPLEFRMGAASIAVRAGARVMPIVIDCQPPTLRKHEPWYHIPRTRPHWRFKIHPATPLESFIENGLSQRLAVRALQSSLLDFYRKQIPGHRD